MKQLKHNFGNHDPNVMFVNYKDVCVYCGKKAQDLYKSIYEKLQVGICPISYQEDSFIKQCEFFDKYEPCIFYEEYVIKSIIE